MYVFMHKRNVSLRQQKHMFEMKMIKFFFGIKTSFMSISLKIELLIIPNKTSEFKLYDSTVHVVCTVLVK